MGPEISRCRQRRCPTDNAIEHGAARATPESQKMKGRLSISGSRLSEEQAGSLFYLEDVFTADAPRQVHLNSGSENDITRHD